MGACKKRGCSAEDEDRLILPYLRHRDAVRRNKRGGFTYASRVVKAGDDTWKVVFTVSPIVDKVAKEER